jgi:hypothetical protein
LPKAEDLRVVEVGPGCAFEIQAQCGNHWCWLAVAVSVTRFYDKSVKTTQCELAKGDPDAGVPGLVPGCEDCKQCDRRHLSESCDKRGKTREALTRVKRFVDEHAFSWDMLMEELSDAEPRPPAVVFPEDSHAMIACSYVKTDGAGFVWFKDPNKETLTKMTKIDLSGLVNCLVLRTRKIP